MEITEVKVFPIHEEKLKAFVSVVFDGCFMVNDIKIICGRDGLFISMPSRKKKNGEFKDVAHPLNNPTRQMIESKVLAEYDRVLAEAREDGDEERPRAREPRHQVRPLPVDEFPRRRDERRSPPPVDSGVAPLAAVSAAGPGHEAVAAAPAAEMKDDETTLEEIEQIHLRDSFWTVT